MHTNSCGESEMSRRHDDSESVECDALVENMKVYKSFSDTLRVDSEWCSARAARCDPMSDRVFMLNGVWWVISSSDWIDIVCALWQLKCHESGFHSWLVIHLHYTMDGSWKYLDFLFYYTMNVNWAVLKNRFARSAIPFKPLILALLFREKCN